jgi:hypothetical protein
MQDYSSVEGYTISRLRPGAADTTAGSRSLPFISASICNAPDVCVLTAPYGVRSMGIRDFFGRKHEEHFIEARLVAGCSFETIISFIRSFLANTKLSCLFINSIAFIERRIAYV